MANDNIKHAYYSKKAHDAFGDVIYKDLLGREVSVTVVSNTKEWVEQNYKWDDKVYLGEVREFVRSNKDSYGMFMR